MDVKLDNIKWGEFLFKDIFIIKNGFYNKKPNSSNKGTIPFIGATANNNGVTEFYTYEEIESSSKIGYGKNEPIEQKLFNGNCIVVTNNGSVGYAYYQKHKFSCSHDVNPLYLKNYELTENLAKFLIATIEKQRVCFEYARKWRPMRMKKSKILLPITTQNTPHYAFMEQYIKQLQADKVQQHKAYFKEQLNEFKKSKPPLPLNEKEWKEFDLKEIFLFEKGNQNNMTSLLSGNFPLVSAKKEDNGYKGFVTPNNKKQFLGNCLTLNNDGDGGAGISYFQPYNFLLDSHVTALYPKAQLSKNILLFISRCITNQRKKFGHGYSINNSRLKAFKFMLPYNIHNEQPDYEYMENYIKYLQFKKLKNYLSLNT